MSRIFDSVVAMLATEPLTKLETLVKTKQAAEYLMQEYPPRELNLTHDTQDAADAANYRSYLRDRAEKNWPKLPEQVQNDLIAQLRAVDPGLEEYEVRLLD